MLPLEVLEQARDELVDWHQSGMSVMEISHRSKPFEQVAAEAEADLRDLLSIPRNYKVLFLQGGASAQFAFVPMNLAAPESTVDYVNTGHWSRKAIAEAGRYCKVHIAGDAGGTYTRVPAPSELHFSAGAAYAHYTPNETIGGVEFGYVPETRGVPLVADMSSSILSRPIDVSRFGLIYAGRAEEHRPLRIDGGDRARRSHRRMRAAGTPLVFDYKAIADNQSMLNTPPTFAWYMAGLVFKWLKTSGGIGGRGRAKPRQGANPVRRNRCVAAVREPGRNGCPVLDERDVHAEQAGVWMRPFLLQRPMPGCRASRGIEYRAACARASTMPCRCPASRP